MIRTRPSNGLPAASRRQLIMRPIARQAALGTRSTEVAEIVRRRIAIGWVAATAAPRPPQSQHLLQRPQHCSRDDIRFHPGMTLRGSDRPATAATTVDHPSGVAPSLSGRMSGIGTNPNLPSGLRSGRWRVITGRSATLQQCNSLKTLGAAVASPHRASDRGARRVPAALFGPSHPAPGDLGCF